jgi:hypothetical protein
MFPSQIFPRQAYSHPVESRKHPEELNKFALNLMLEGFNTLSRSFAAIRKIAKSDN